MKIIGTEKEICWITDLLRPKLFYQEIPFDVYKQLSGKANGFNIDFEITKKPMMIGLVIGDTPDHIVYEYACKICDKHKGLERSQKKMGEGFFCDTFDNSHIETILRFGLLHGHKFDELWMNSFPSNWDEFDLCMNSVIGDRSKIHFFKELNNETT